MRKIDYDNLSRHFLFKILICFFLLFSAFSFCIGAIHILVVYIPPIGYNISINRFLGVFIGLIGLTCNMVAAIFIFKIDGPFYETIDKARANARKYVIYQFINNNDKIRTKYLILLIVLGLYAIFSYYAHYKHGFTVT